MLLDGLCLIRQGCGIAGAMTGRNLTRLGATVVGLRRSPCSVCGDVCDEEEVWRRDWSPGSTVRYEAAEDAGPDPLLTAAESVGKIDGVIIDGASEAEISYWTQRARVENFPTLIFSTAGLNWGSPIGDSQRVAEADGLIAEAISGVVGTMGPEGDPPTPFGYLFGEANLAVRAACLLVDRLLLRSTSGSGPESPDPVIEVSAADACIDAMDNPWQEFSLPGPVHLVSNSLTRKRYQRTGPQKVGLVPYGMFQSRDGWVCLVGASTTALLSERLNRPDLLDDERFQTIEGRVANREFVVGLLQEWILSFESGEEFVTSLGDQAIAAEARRLDEVSSLDQHLLGFDSPTAPFRISAKLPEENVLGGS